MGDLREFLMLVSQLGGMGALAWVLLGLHRETIQTFREEQREERKTWAEAMTVLRGEKQTMHDVVIARLERIEDEVKEVRRLCENES